VAETRNESDVHFLGGRRLEGQRRTSPGLGRGTGREGDTHVNQEQSARREGAGV
jgi:hypothetical protein